MTRVAVLDPDRCRSSDCGRVCLKYCPMVRNKIEAIAFEKGRDKPVIIESLCSGCGICIKKCPFMAISIVNLPDELDKDVSHRFGRNMFKLFRLPIPREGFVTGLLGKNGIGKSTALKILAGEIKPNLGELESPPEWSKIIEFYRGSVLQEYFNKISNSELRVIHKPQHVDRIPLAISGEVGALLEKNDELGKLKVIRDVMELDTVWNRELNVLSGGELQRVAVSAAMLRKADVYLFDEPSSYLDIRQRIRVARAIRELAKEGHSIIVAEHDLAVLDYLSDQICIFYGEPTVYGVVSHVYGVRVGINVYLNGYLPDENVRFRESVIKFHVKPPEASWASTEILTSWGEMVKSFGFALKVNPGNIHIGEVIGILGPNGTGKTTFVKLLTGLLEPDEGKTGESRDLTISYKPQYISIEYDGTVEEILRIIVGSDFNTGWYKSDIIKPLNLDKILDRKLDSLSGGELQRVAIATCLSKHASLYLLDEPSAYLDVEERLSMTRTLRKLVEDRSASAFIVEHDIVAQDFLSDNIMVFEGVPGVKSVALKPLSLREGMNRFLEDMGITFRRDPDSQRPRVNKEGSRLDREQKLQKEYYYIPKEENNL